MSQKARSTPLKRWALLQERRQPDERPDRCVAPRAPRYGADACRVAPARGAAPHVRGLRTRVLPPARRRQSRRARTRGPVGCGAVALAAVSYTHLRAHETPE